MSEDSSIGGQSFPTTRWSLICQSDDAKADVLETFCQLYWRPIYSFLRRKGIDRCDAEDLTQSFFVRFLKKDDLFRADQKKGRLRTFLLGALNRHLTDDYRHRSAAKRGYGQEHVPILVSEKDFEEAESIFISLPAHEDSPDRFFDQNWALDLLARTHQRIQRDYRLAKKIKEYELLKPTIATSGEIDAPKAARELGISEGTVRVFAHRLRKNFRAALKEEIAETVTSREEVDQELAYLMSVFS